MVGATAASEARLMASQMAVTFVNPAEDPDKAARVGAIANPWRAGSRRAHAFRAGSARFGINNPFAFAERGEPLREGVSIGQLGQIAEEGQLP